MKKRTSSMSRRIVSLLMSMVLTLTLVTPAAFAEGMGAYANGEDTTVTTPIGGIEAEEAAVALAAPRLRRVRRREIRIGRPTRSKRMQASTKSQRRRSWRGWHRRSTRAKTPLRTRL